MNRKQLDEKALHQLRKYAGLNEAVPGRDVSKAILEIALSLKKKGFAKDSIENIIRRNPQGAKAALDFLENVITDMELG